MEGKIVFRAIRKIFPLASTLRGKYGPRSCSSYVQKKSSTNAFALFLVDTGECRHSDVYQNNNISRFPKDRIPKNRMTHPGC